MMMADPGQRLVEQQDRGTHRQRPRDFQALQHAKRLRAGKLVGEIADPHRCQMTAGHALERATVAVQDGPQR